MPVRYSRIISSGSMSCAGLGLGSGLVLQYGLGLGLEPGLGLGTCDSWPRCSPETSATKWSPPSPVCCGL
eukprot:scaffold52489_cov25-Phaeocystis_antarctica.AAC.1